MGVSYERGTHVVRGSRRTPRRGRRGVVDQGIGEGRGVVGRGGDRLCGPRSEKTKEVLLRDGLLRGGGIGVEGFDRVLLELMIATALREDPRAGRGGETLKACQEGLVGRGVHVDFVRCSRIAVEKRRNTLPHLSSLSAWSHLCQHLGTQHYKTESRNITT